MSSPPETSRPGLRERKKARTRASIREHAMRLFREQGYPATTVEQVAEAAEVSPSTFFRYFPTKEAVVLADDLDSRMLRALEEQPAGVTPLAAMRAALRTVLDSLSAAEYAFEHERTALILSEPELRSAIGDEFTRTVGLYVRVLATRTGRDSDDFEVKAFAGAVVGATLAVSGPPADLYTAAARALDYLQAGLPL